MIPLLSTVVLGVLLGIPRIRRPSDSQASKKWGSELSLPPSKLYQISRNQKLLVPRTDQGARLETLCVKSDSRNMEFEARCFGGALLSCNYQRAVIV